MIIKLELMKPFSDVLGNRESDYDFEGSTLRDLIEDMVSKHPDMKKLFFEDDGLPTYYLTILVNGKSVPPTDEAKLILRDSDKVVMFVPISGG